MSESVVCWTDILLFCRLWRVANQSFVAMHRGIFFFTPTDNRHKPSRVHKKKI